MIIENSPARNDVQGPLDIRLVLALAVTILAVAVSLVRFPAPDVDEMWYAARAVGMATTGVAFGTLDSGVNEHYAGYWTYYPVIGTFIQSLAIRVLGLNLVAIRLPSLVFGLLLLWATYDIGRRLYSPPTGVTAALLIATSVPFLFSAHLGRQDVYVAALGYLAIALYLGDISHRFAPKGLIAGLLVGLGFEIHPNGMIFGAVIATLFVMDHGLSVVRIPSFWGFSAGATVGIVLFLVLHVLPYPQTYFALSSVFYGGSKTPPIFAGSVERLAISVRDFAVFILIMINFRLPVAVPALVRLIRERSRIHRQVFVILGTMIGMFVLVIAVKPPFYIIELSPALDILLAGFLCQLWTQSFAGPKVSGFTAQRARFGRLALYCGLLVASTIYNALPLLGHPLDNLNAVTTNIRDVVPEEATIIGPQYYWLNLADHRYLSWEQIAYFGRYQPGSTIGDAFCSLGANYLILDHKFDGFIVDDASIHYAWQATILLPKTEFSRFLESHGRLALNLTTTDYGSVRVYEIDHPCDRAP